MKERKPLNSTLPPTPERPPLRPDASRPSSPLLDRLRGKTRRHTLTSDRFLIPEEDKPAGVSFNWKRWSVHGQEDPFYIANMRLQGWEPVNGDDMPGLVPEGHTGPIIKEGVILMARAQELTDRLGGGRARRQQCGRRERRRPNGKRRAFSPTQKKSCDRSRCKRIDAWD
jgi:hypothetical protein